ncbi:hypothetical protein C8R44DRAFT_896483 [Mycena epipterygia]|nr:hypothetical protein C8R44DRAFT_896483 [Mycena epipterygia]
MPEWQAHFGEVGIKRPSAGVFAAATTKAAKGTRYTQPKPPAKHTVSLPRYAQSGTGSFTASFAASEFGTDVGTEVELKRSSSFHSPGASRFVEKLEGLPSASTHEHPYPTTHDYAPDSPITPTTAASEAASSASLDFVLPLHVAWHARVYPADHGLEDESDADEEPQWSPASDAHSMEVFPTPPQVVAAAAAVIPLRSSSLFDVPYMRCELHTMHYFTPTAIFLTRHSFTPALALACTYPPRLRTLFATVPILYRVAPPSVSLPFFFVSRINCVRVYVLRVCVREVVDAWLSGVGAERCLNLDMDSLHPARFLFIQIA